MTGQDDNGFTGVLWDARPTARLIADLNTGPGAAPLHTAAAAWADLAAACHDAATEFGAIVAEIGRAWQSDTGESASGRLLVLRNWLADSAIAAGANADRATGQADAYETARRTMPDGSPLDAVADLEHGLLGQRLLGGPLIGLADALNTVAGTASTHAARVMSNYEAAAAPLATPWQQQPPPVITASEPAGAPRPFRPTTSVASEILAAPAPVPASAAAYRDAAIPSARPAATDAAPLLSPAAAPPATTAAAPSGAVAAHDKSGQSIGSEAGADRLGLGSMHTVPATLGATRTAPSAPAAEAS
ncbi:PPE domain-containing protein [Nocardia sp. NPDC127526]|uniref:PPE domain-containing protein n=1 Tax=Nocardia sp. NPDC127526 TaxID=3345393 RepID=UPI003642A765